METMQSNSCEVESDLNVPELNAEILQRIKSLQEQHDTEIQSLANELNLRPYFVKSIMKDYREPAIRKPRKISGFNIWQSNWWTTYGRGLSIKDPGAQKLCAEQWNALDSNARKHYEEEAKKTLNSRSKDSFITNTKSRITNINNGVQDIRKMFRNLQVTCGMEFVTLAVSNSDELRSHWFGSNVGEEFYKTYSNLSDAIIPFRCFSILKKKENEGIIRSVTRDEQEVDPMSNTTLLSGIDFSKPNSIETRNKVRSVLRQKFGKDVKSDFIPYKRWKTQNSYKVIGWPSDVEFQDYSKLRDEERIKVLESLHSISFEQI